MRHVERRLGSVNHTGGHNGFIPFNAKVFSRESANSYTVVRQEPNSSGTGLTDSQDSDSVNLSYANVHELSGYDMLTSSMLVRVIVRKVVDDVPHFECIHLANTFLCKVGTGAGGLGGTTANCALKYDIQALDGTVISSSAEPVRKRIANTTYVAATGGTYGMAGYDGVNIKLLEVYDELWNPGTCT